MLRYARAIIQQFHEAEEAMARLQGISGGKLNVSVISAGDYFFPRLLAEFTRRNPGITLNLAVHNREELIAPAQRQPDRPGRDGTSATGSGHDQPVLCAPPLRYRGATRSPPGTQEEYPHFGAGERTVRGARKKALIRATPWKKVSPGACPTLTSRWKSPARKPSSKRLLRGMGISFLSAHTISLELQVGNLAVLDVQGFPVLLNWFLVHRKNKRLPPVAEAFQKLFAQRRSQPDRAYHAIAVVKASWA